MVKSGSYMHEFNIGEEFSSSFLDNILQAGIQGLDTRLGYKAPETPQQTIRCIAHDLIFISNKRAHNFHRQSK
jgi:hypothetical protein